LVLQAACTRDDVELSTQCTRKATSIKNTVFREGMGLFTGLAAKIVLLPAPAGTGIVFERNDLLGQPKIQAIFNNVHSTPRCTILSSSGASIQTVEHVLAAVAALGVDNLIIRIDAPEVPIFDGSSLVFVEMLQQAEVVELESERLVHRLQKPLFWVENDTSIIALPSHSFKISYTLDYPQSTLIGSQFFSLDVNAKTFIKELSSSRTFSLFEEIMPYIEKGLIRWGSLENAVIVKGDSVMNPEGLRFPNEMVRHKILDMLGDLSLVGIPFIAHIIAVKAGHAANSSFARLLHQHIMSENL
jgi:UDP-3-O-[3-hydroxymyristoyl] N-acetylglucosamine deacetylase